jgi:hypothetical protein
MTITSKQINLAQLSIELGGKGLIADFTDPKKKLILPADGVEISDAELKAAIDAHVAIDENAAKEAERQTILNRIGITADEAKLILG